MHMHESRVFSGVVLGSFRGSFQTLTVLISLTPSTVYSTATRQIALDPGVTFWRSWVSFCTPASCAHLACGCKIQSEAFLLSINRGENKRFAAQIWKISQFFLVLEPPKYSLPFHHTSRAGAVTPLTDTTTITGNASFTPYPCSTSSHLSTTSQPRGASRCFDYPQHSAFKRVGPRFRILVAYTSLPKILVQHKRGFEAPLNTYHPKKQS